MGRSFSRLRSGELDICREFLMNNVGLNPGEFELAVNRLFLDKQVKPRNWTIMVDLLTSANLAFQLHQKPDFYSRYRRR